MRRASAGVARVCIHLKGGRANLLDVRSVVDPLAQVAADTGCHLDLRVDDHAPALLRDELAEVAGERGLTVEVAPRRALRRPPLDPSAEHHRRTAQLDDIQRVHRDVYRAVVGAVRT